MSLETKNIKTLHATFSLQRFHSDNPLRVTRGAVKIDLLAEYIKFKVDI